MPPNEHELALRQVDQLRTEIAHLESGQEFLMQQIARMATQATLARAALGIIFSTAIVTTLLNWWLLFR